MSRSEDAFDVVIVGAGPGGSAAALAALSERPDARVLILDRSSPGRDKVCGDGVGPDSVAELSSLGIAEVLRPVERRSRFHLEAGSRSWQGNATAPGYVVPRAEFDHRLLSAALAAGAEFRQRTVRAIDRRPDRVVVDGEFAGTVLIGADGANSIVRRFLGEAPNRGRHVVLAVRGYVPSPAGFEELYLRWDPSPGDRLGYAWAFPTAHGTVNVGYGSAAPGQNKASLVGRAAALLPGFAVEAAEMTGHLLPLSTHRPRPAAGNVLMVGDAASLINPLTGEGIFYALASGALAGRAAVRPEAAERYSQALQVRFGRHHRQTRLLAQFVDRPGVMSAALRACSRDERVFARLLSVGLADGSFSVGELAWFAFAALAVRPDRPRTGHDR